MSIVGLCFISIVILTSKHVNCVCKESLNINCDNLEDVKNYRTETWHELTIGNLSTLPDAKFATASLSDEFFWYVPNLYSLTIINRLDNGWMNKSLPGLDYLNFYKNAFSTLSLNLFSKFTNLRTLILRDNAITSLVSNYKGKSLRLLDLSLNHFEAVQSRQFFDSNLKWVSIKNCKLNTIKASPFPSTLQVLSLDYNNLEEINDESINNLQALEELFISHNKLNKIPEVRNLSNIRVLDFSYNQIFSVFNIFSRLKNLNYVDLSHNKIATVYSAAEIDNQYYFIRISVVFNRLANIDSDALKSLFGSSSKTIDKKLSLYGNPFFCPCLDQIPRSFKELSYSDCDVKFFSSGHTPVCIQADTENCPDNSTRPDEGSVKKFLDGIEAKKGEVGCNLELEFYYERNDVINRRKLYD